MALRCAWVATILAALSFDASLGQTPLGTGFTYQGQLKQNGQPYNGSANLIFKLFDAATGGNLLGTQTLNGVNVSAGLFTVRLDPNSEFGANAFDGQSRWLEVTANGTLLTPRQALMATPYAEFAAAPWRMSGSSISYTAGNVGIGTATPGLKLTVAGDAELGATAGDYHHLRLGGGNSSGFLYGSYPRFGDGIHIGYNYYADAAGNDIIPRTDGQTSRVSTGYGYVSLATGGTNAPPVDRLFVATSGNVGIGTSSPSATLHVNGNLGVGVANIPAGLTAELGGTNTPILNLDMNFRHPNHNTSFVGGALRIDARNDAADPLFQFISRPAGSNTESIVAVLTEHGRLAVGGAQFFTPGSNLELNGLGGSEIIFQCSQLPDHGLLVWSEQFMLQNRFGTTGTAVLNDNGSWYVQSDRRLKSDITPATGLLDKALALRPAEFYMKYEDPASTPHKHLGLIAQEVQPVLPELVCGADMLSLDYSRLGVVAIGAIQEQQALIAGQKQTIAAQQEQIKALNDEVAATRQALDKLHEEVTARFAKMDAAGSHLAK